MVFYKSSNQCCGCGACMQTCERKAISMKEDEEGFLYPVIDEELCINCGKCVLKCQINKSKKFINQKDERVMYAAYNRDWNVRSKSSSGGVFFSLARNVLQKGGVVFGAAFDSNYEVEHIGIEDECELKKLLGSKYVQSNVKYTYKEVKKQIENGKEVLYAGTPCQISGLRSFLDIEDLNKVTLVSVICHGVCSPMVWRKYLSLKKGQYDKEKITGISFRDKKNGWRNFELDITLGDRHYSQSHKRDIYMKGFLQNLYLRPSCYECKAKQNLDYSDVIIGDFWGIEKTYPEMDDDKGVSCVILNSRKGKKIWDNVKVEFVITEVTYESIIEENVALTESPSIHANRSAFFKDLRKEGLVEKSIGDYMINYSDAYRKLSQYPILHKYLSNYVEGRKIVDAIKDRGWNKISLYAMTDLMELVYRDIVKEDLGVSVECICDKGYKKFKEPYNMSVEIIGIEKLKDKIEGKEVDGVILCNPMWESVILQELEKYEISKDRVATVLELM